MHASGLEGPIPSNISLLTNLTQLRISDIKGPSQNFPILSNMKGMIRLILRSCNITGELPSYMWTMNKLEMFDVSFNKLVGEIPATSIEGHLRFLDLSYNNFAWQGPEQPTCQDNLSEC
ncbi:hypothetical protein RIF29_37947 [Crotalaria pallida]|uniref:Uncharacterized protein n=1 Tax=Crotalaria pallida TaxID=3830 RepID=A0AAN9DYP1_CROPI